MKEGQLTCERARREEEEAAIEMDGLKVEKRVEWEEVRIEAIKAAIE